MSRYETIKEQNAIKKAELSKRAIEHKSAESFADDELARCGQILKDAEGQVLAQNGIIDALLGEIAQALFKNPISSFAVCSFSVTTFWILPPSAVSTAIS